LNFSEHACGFNLKHVCGQRRVSQIRRDEGII
jgi:hypothetical protein